MDKSKIMELLDGMEDALVLATSAADTLTLIRLALGGEAVDNLELVGSAMYSASQMLDCWLSDLRSSLDLLRVEVVGGKEAA